jgi:hypothetical protein
MFHDEILHVQPRRRREDIFSNQEPEIITVYSDDPHMQAALASILLVTRMGHDKLFVRLRAMNR